MATSIQDVESAALGLSAKDRAELAQRLLSSLDRDPEVEAELATGFNRPVPTLESLPIFPLEAVTLLPGALLPLHVFEPRYRQMIADAMEGDRAIAMAMPLPGHATDSERRPPVHPVIALGHIVQHAPLAEGRANIVLRGVARLRIEEELAADLPYRIVRASELPDHGGDESLVPRVVALAARASCVDAGRIAALAHTGQGAALDVVLLALELPPRDAHRLHAVTDVAERLAAIERAVDARDGRHHLRIDRGDPRLN